MKIFGVGPAYWRRLEKLGVKTAEDLLYHLPFRYDDFSLISPIANLQEGETVTVRGKVLEIKNEYTRGRFVLQKAKISDDTGVLDVLWFNQRFLPRIIQTGDVISLAGKVEKNAVKLQMSSPAFEKSDSSLHTGRLVPIYPETLGLSSKWLRSRIFFLLKDLKLNDFLSQDILDSLGSMGLDEAIHQVHFPASLAEAEVARRRLAFNELLISQLQTQQRKLAQQKKAVGHKFDLVGKRSQLRTFIDHLPFSLTSAQKRVIGEIYKDLARPIAMNRLLQGDVGCGKTVVAALAMLAAYLNGYQSALMAPTEILANQHYQTIGKLLKPLKITIGIATGSRKDYAGYDIVVGTHALLSDKLSFFKLGLVVIDEQHRFGVSQRAKLVEKGINPHILTMTATPIPRTVALTLYGDLDLSIIDEMPKNRLPVKTWVIPQTKRDAAYNWIKKQQTQAFIICPLIEEAETLQTVKSAKKEYDHLSKIVFPDLKLGLIHGRLKAKDKDGVLENFRRQKLDILVATPVVEVGIDIPGATIMVIEAADRFGLAQLHQLRGRVGRNDRQSYCLLFTQNESKTAVRRLKYLETLNDGLKLAEVDLKFRGPGQRFGTAQHGRWGLKIADFSDLDLIEKSAELVEKVIRNPHDFPLLLEKVQADTIKPL